MVKLPNFVSIIHVYASFTGETPLHHATLCQHYPTTLYLLENGANPSLVNDKDRFTALHYAAEAGLSHLYNNCCRLFVIIHFI